MGVTVIETNGGDILGPLQRKDHGAGVPFVKSDLLPYCLPIKVARVRVHRLAGERKKPLLRVRHGTHF
jgi:hypothetical protein